ncbi:phosphoribosyl pyrophosphate synthase-associated 1 isoform X2 [Paramuricea clavata]|uniref:Phosphoribosyl pyrophosphate synthase-associated 1 isoform X2 n=1 Tax=Paramuricea clavata TaxID=317549 RepID=A0A7D9D5C5_PARCT|nr:phosphoribosyl pyrophosphate synthase-associated 1 isoform X2 [Paramuricea clavata]
MLKFHCATKLTSPDGIKEFPLPKLEHPSHFVNSAGLRSRTTYVVGDVRDKIAVIVNDLIDDASPYIVASQVLKSNGAKEVYVVVTHGILSGCGPEQVQSSDIDGLIMTNTVEHEEKKKRCNKIKTIDISGLLSEAIRRIHNGESIAYLFRNVSVDE